MKKKTVLNPKVSEHMPEHLQEKQYKLYTLEMPRALWQFKIAIMLSKMVHDHVRKMVIFRGFIKLPEGT